MKEDKILKFNENFEYISNDTFNYIEKYTVKTNDIILSIVGTIGNLNIIDTSLNNANLSENCVKITNLKEINFNYLYYYLKSPIGRNEIFQGIVGAVQKKLPIKNIKEITIRYPDTNKQKK